MQRLPIDTMNSSLCSRSEAPVTELNSTCDCGAKNRRTEPNPGLTLDKHRLDTGERPLSLRENGPAIEKRRTTKTMTNFVSHLSVVGYECLSGRDSTEAPACSLDPRLPVGGWGIPTSERPNDCRRFHENTPDREIAPISTRFDGGCLRKSPKMDCVLMGGPLIITLFQFFLSF